MKKNLEFTIFNTLGRQKHIGEKNYLDKELSRSQDILYTTKMTHKPGKIGFFFENTKKRSKL